MIEKKAIQELIKYLNEQVEKSIAIRREKKIVVTHSEKEKNFVIKKRCFLQDFAKSSTTS